jgi:hypothetical protein
MKFETKTKFIHGIEHLFRTLAYLTFGLSLVAVIAALGKVISKNWITVAGVADIIAFALLYITWNIRTNFRRILPD